MEFFYKYFSSSSLGLARAHARLMHPAHVLSFQMRTMKIEKPTLILLLYLLIPRCKL
jgi:hypothetical protein